MQVPHKVILVEEVVELPAAEFDDVDEIECVIIGRNGWNVWILWPAQAIPPEIISRAIKEQCSCWKSFLVYVFMREA